MKILDSYNNIKWKSSGVSFVDKNIVMSAKSSLSTGILSFKNAKIKIIGKKISGNGILKLYIKKKSGEIFFQKEIKFTKSSWSEYSFECKENIDNCIIEISRSKNSFGRIELGRVIVSDDRIIKPIIKKPKEKRSDEVRQMELYMQSISFNKKIAVIIPYGIYGGGEVYIKNIFSKTKDMFHIDFLYLSKNKLEFELSNPNIKHKLIRTLDRLSATLISHNYDTVIFYNSKKIYDVISKLKEKKKITAKVIEIYHSDFIWGDAVANTRSRSGVDNIFKVSEELTKDIVGVLDKNKILMPVGIDTSVFIRRENRELRKELGIRGETVFGMVARLSPEKNIEYALSLVKGLEDIRLLIVGSGPQEGRLKAFAKEHNIDNVLFLGQKNNVSDFYNIFDAFLLTSKMEGTPISILEAMSCCLPIYSTGVGQIANNFASLDNFNILSGSLKSDRKLIKSQIDQQNYHQNLREYIIKNHNIKAISNKFFMNILSSALTFREKSRDSKVIFGEYI